MGNQILRKMRSSIIRAILILAAAVGALSLGVTTNTLN